MGSVLIDRFATKRSAQILARLAVAHQHRLTRVQLTQSLWPDEDFETTRVRLRQELKRLRQSIVQCEAVLVAEPEFVCLDASKVEIDVVEFERLTRSARWSSDAVMTREFLRRATDICIAPFMAGSNDEWILVERARLDVARYAALTDLGQLLLGLGEGNDALILAQRAIGILPEREAAHLTAAQALQMLGHTDAAVAQLYALRNSIRLQGGQLSAKAELISSGLVLPVDPDEVRTLGPHFSFPAPAEPIFGRDDELSRIAELLNPAQFETRILTVLGMGGIGKTHLLRYACRELSGPFNGRIAYVDLSRLTEAAFIPGEIMRSLGLQYIPSPDPLKHLCRVLGTEPLVLVLDNLEQFGLSVVPIVQSLLERNPTLRILGGSRTPLGIGGEVRFHLMPLSLPSPNEPEISANHSASVRLFLSSVHSHQRGSSMNRGEWDTVLSIIRQLDGVPLGLQLAATRMRTIGSTALLNELRSHPLTLVNPRGDAPERHRSLRSSVEASFNSLDPDLLRIIARLSIFRGGWTVSAAERVCEIESASLVLEKLVDASLLSISHEFAVPRFMALETIREFASGFLTDDERHLLSERLVAWVVHESATVDVDFVDAKINGQLTRLEPEIDNIRQATRFALQFDLNSAVEIGANLAYFWLFRTSGYEADQFYQELFNRVGSSPATLSTLRASFGHSLIAAFVQTPLRASIYDRTIRLGREVGDRSLEIRTRVFQAFLAQNSIRYADCNDFIELIDHFIEEYGAYDSGAYVSRVKGCVFHFQGQPQKAIPYFRDAIDRFQQQGELCFEARTRVDLGLAALDVGDVELATAALSGLRERVQEIRFTRLIPFIDSCEGRIALNLGRHQDAVSAFQRSIGGWVGIGDVFLRAEQWNSIGRTELGRGNLVEAKDAFATAATLWFKNSFPVAASVALAGLARVQLRLGQPIRALRMFHVLSNEIELSGARLILFHSQFIRDLEADLRSLPDFSGLESDRLRLREAIALGSTD